jgi:H+-translocating NAD(P) transhydrogenase subunit alpha
LHRTREAGLKIAILRDTRPFERRVSATPETVKKLIGLGFELAVETGAGAGASITDAAYTDAGAHVADRAATLAGANMVFAVQGPDANELAGFAKGTVLIASLNPFQRKDSVAAYASAGITAMAMELMPRITRAQSMDILSSQSNLSGYKAVLDAAAEYGGAFPMMMTAAGTISAAKAFVMGVGVAGLQAIATARRLGAMVSATDVRAATKEQIESLGAKAIFVQEVKGIEGEGTGGYATEMSDEYKRAQAELVSAHITKQDIVITTALIPGRAAPRLISAAQIATMKTGSVIVDLAVEQGGNVEGSVAGEIVTTANGVKIVGHRNVPSRLASDASALFARNLFNFVSAFYDKDTKSIKWDFEDELLKAVVVAKDGAVMREELR